MTDHRPTPLCAHPAAELARKVQGHGLVVWDDDVWEREDVAATVCAAGTCFAVTREAARRERLAEETIRRPHAVLAGGRSVKAVDTALAAKQDLADELRAFREEAERVAGLGWTPDLDDGIILCAAPLAGLLPAWPDAAGAREELRRRKYPWAGVSRWAGEL